MYIIILIIIIWWLSTRPNLPSPSEINTNANLAASHIVKKVCTPSHPLYLTELTHQTTTKTDNQTIILHPHGSQHTLSPHALPKNVMAAQSLHTNDTTIQHTKDTTDHFCVVHALGKTKKKQNKKKVFQTKQIKNTALSTAYQFVLHTFGLSPSNTRIYYSHHLFVLLSFQCLHSERKKCNNDKKKNKKTAFPTKFSTPFLSLNKSDQTPSFQIQTNTTFVLSYPLPTHPHLHTKSQTTKNKPKKKKNRSSINFIFFNYKVGVGN